MIDTIKSRVLARLHGESYDESVITELVQTVFDRLCIRLGVTTANFPAVFASVAVDATIKAWRRRYFEGLSSEGTVSLTSSFFEDILNEYNDEISDWLASASAKEAESSVRRGVRFI
jgi:hypothetical protein